jgi:hypothetical protein
MITDIIRAGFAGEPLTQADVEALEEYRRQGAATDRWLVRRYSPKVIAATEGVDMGAAFFAYRAEILRELRQGPTVGRLRHLVRELVEVLAIFVELHAATTGKRQRVMKQLSHGSHGAAAAKRTKAVGLLAEIDRLKKESPRTSQVSVIKQHLRQTDPTWKHLTDDQREQKVAAYARRVRRARKKYGH